MNRADWINRLVICSVVDSIYVVRIHLFEKNTLGCEYFIFVWIVVILGREFVDWWIKKIVVIFSSI